MRDRNTETRNAPAARQPNVLFLMTDQQRADTLDPAGMCQTPHLSDLAASGTRFSRCYAANPICSPSRASLLTGLLPHNHGMVDCTHTVEPYRASLKPDLRFWSRDFRDAGYSTGYYGKWHVERSNDLASFGFEHFELPRAFMQTPQGYSREDHPNFLAHRKSLGLGARRSGLTGSRYVRQKGYRDMLLYGVTDEPTEGTQEHYIFSRGIDFLHEAASEPHRPWMLFLSTEAPHDPYVAPREHYERYDPATIPRPESFDDSLRHRPGIYRRLQNVWSDLAWEDFAEATACYYALCSLIDDQVGRILTTLRHLGQLDDTIVVFTSDHGDLMGAHRLMLKGVPAFEEVYRVPLVMSGPGIPAGQHVDRVTSLLDVAPSLTQLALDQAFDGDGRSLLPLLGGGGPWEEEAYAEMHGQRLFYTQRVLWRESFKYVFNGFDEDELYDLSNDPHELRNLVRDPELNGVLAEMNARLWDKVRETGDYNLGQAQDGMYRFMPVGPEYERELDP